MQSRNNHVKCFKICLPLFNGKLQEWVVMVPKIPPVSRTVLAHYKWHLYNEKKGPSREYRCGTGKTPSEGQVRIFLTALEC